MKRLLLLLTLYVSILMHAAGCAGLVLAASLGLQALVANDPHRDLTVFRHRDGERFWTVTAYEDGAVRISRGNRRQENAASSQLDEQNIFRLGGKPKRHWIRVFSHTEGGLTASGKPVLEYVGVTIHPAFLALLATVLVGISVLPPGGRGVIWCYRKLFGVIRDALRSFANLVPGTRRQPRGFEVVTPKAKHSS